MALSLSSSVTLPSSDGTVVCLKNEKIHQSTMHESEMFITGVPFRACADELVGRCDAQL